MRFSGRLVAICGAMLFCSAMLPVGEALAFGHQWRPAPGFLPAQGQAYRPAANMSGFRPGAAVRPAYAQPLNRMQQRPYPQRTLQWPIRQQGAYAQGYRMPPVGSPHAAGFYPPQWQFAPPGYAFQGGVSPSASQARIRPGRPPMFAQQYAWRPAGLPWVAQRARPEWPQQRKQAQVRMPPQMVGFRPAGTGYPAPAGAWRPAVRPAPSMHPQYAYQRYDHRAPGYTPDRRPMFRSGRPPAWPMPDARVASLSPAPMAQPYWRPAPAAAAAWHRDTSFRPAAYGRPMAGGPASRDRDRSTATRDSLPGWVTTYRETDTMGSCGWCSGS